MEKGGSQKELSKVFAKAGTEQALKIELLSKSLWVSGEVPGKFSVSLVADGISWHPHTTDLFMMPTKELLSFQE